MPRAARLDLGGYPYHVINRSVMGLRIFNTDQDYKLFESVLFSVAREMEMRILAYCLMPNHWHILLHPVADGDLSRYMHRVTNSHTHKIRARTDTIGNGPLYQGRYKSFIIQEDLHLLTVLKYVERNAVRASLSERAELWRWGSAHLRLDIQRARRHLSELPIPLPDNYFDWLNELDRSDDLKSIRRSVNKAAPFGRPTWVEAMASQNQLGATLRPQGRPKK